MSYYDYTWRYNATMTELESKLLMADAIVDIIKTCEPKQKDFWADNSSLLNGKEKRVSHYTLYHAICPECKKEVCSINSPVDRDLVFKE